MRVVVKRTGASRAVSGGRRCDGRLSPCGRKIKVIKDPYYSLLDNVLHDDAARRACLVNPRPGIGVVVIVEDVRHGRRVCS